MDQLVNGISCHSYLWLGTKNVTITYVYAKQTKE